MENNQLKEESEIVPITGSQFSPITLSICNGNSNVTNIVDGKDTNITTDDAFRRNVSDSQEISPTMSENSAIAEGIHELQSKCSGVSTPSELNPENEGRSSSVSPIKLGYDSPDNSLSSAAGLWSNSIDDSLLNIGMNANGPINFSSYGHLSDNVLFDIGLTHHGMQSPIQQLRRYENYPIGPERNSSPQANTLYLGGKNSSNSWCTTPNSWQSSPQNSCSLNPWNRGRSVPNLNPLQNLPSRKPTTLQTQQPNIFPQQKGFRRSTSYPGKNIFSQGFDATSMEEAAEFITPYQDQVGTSSALDTPSPLDNLHSLQHYLADFMGPDNNEFVMKNSGYAGNTPTSPMRQVNHISAGEPNPFYPNMDDNAVLPIMDTVNHNLVHVDYFVGLEHSIPGEERFSRKVFVGGLPPDIDEDEISASFRRFGPLVVDWPHKAESKSYFPPKGYAFLLFQEESSVQRLIDACINEDGKLYLVVSSPTVKDKPVQIRPWKLSDADYVKDDVRPLDIRKTIFVGGVPRPLKAQELAEIMDKMYGGVCYAGIDTDPELRYPKGAGRVAFISHQSYVAAIQERFVQLRWADIDKRVEVKPYVLDDQLCDECNGQLCNGKFAPFFCSNTSCLQYYCEHCWAKIHSKPGREFHKPLVKEGADRPRSGQQTPQFRAW